MTIKFDVEGVYMSEKLTKKIFAERLKRAIDEKEITQANLAKLMGTSVANISNYVCARTFPPVDVLTEIAKALDKSLDWLCGKDDEIYNFKNIKTVGGIIRVAEALEDVGFDGDEFQKYAEDKRKMNAALQRGAIDEGLFDSWKQDRLSALDCIPISLRR